MEKDKCDKAIAYAHRLFSVRPRSERELRERLLRKGFDQTTISDTISRLKEKDLVDDHKFARLWVESRLHANPKGDFLLRKELQDKGISVSIIDKTLAERKGNEESVVRDLATQRLERLKDLPKRESRKKLFDFLARRGFDFDTIETVLKELFG